jgi:hypothetical protein
MQALAQQQQRTWWPVGRAARVSSAAARPPPTTGPPIARAARRRVSVPVAAAAEPRDAAASAAPAAALALAVTAAAAAAACPSAAQAAAEASKLFPYPEPANALSLPTWAIHVSSVAEWLIAMSLAWRYAGASGNPRWKGLTWGMVPALGSAMCACTWHLFYNAPELDALVALQAFLTVVGNFTLWLAAYRLYEAGRGKEEEAEAAAGGE